MHVCMYVCMYVCIIVFSRVLLNRTKAAVDLNLWDQHAGFHRGRSCTDHIATLSIVLNYSCDWNSIFMPTVLIVRRHLTVCTDRASQNC